MSTRPGGRPTGKGQESGRRKPKMVTKTLPSVGQGAQGRPREGGLRLFFGLCPSPALAASLGALAVELSGRYGGRAVPPENLHLTLAFLGSVPAPRVNAAVAAAMRALRTRHGADQELFRLEEIRYWEKAGIVYAAPGLASPRLTALVGALEEALREADFLLEARNFVPHVTLVRKADSASVDAVLPREACADWPQNEIILVRSTQGPRTSVYTPLARIPI